MELTKEFKKNLSLGIVTEEMVGEALYSYNKRAKNYRDKEREARDRAWMYHRKDDNFHSVAKYKKLKEEAYTMKEQVLSYYEPIEIHHSIMENYKGEVYEMFMALYVIGNHSFHQPVTYPNEKYESLPFVSLQDDFVVDTVDLKMLISKQSAKRILETMMKNAKEAGVTKAEQVKVVSDIEDKMNYEQMMDQKRKEVFANKVNRSKLSRKEEFLFKPSNLVSIRSRYFEIVTDAKRLKKRNIFYRGIMISEEGEEYEFGIKGTFKEVLFVTCEVDDKQLLFNYHAFSDKNPLKELEKVREEKEFDKFYLGKAVFKREHKKIAQYNLPSKEELDVLYNEFFNIKEVA